MSFVYLDDPDPTTRPLAPNERFQLSAANIGHPSTFAFLATLPRSTNLTLITEPALLEAIRVLLRIHPILRCAIVEGRGLAPAWKVQCSLGPSAVLVIRADSSARSDEELLEELVNLGPTFDGARGPLWRVVWYVGSPDRLGLSIAHVPSDGVGARNLFADLLKLLREPGAFDFSLMLKYAGDLAPSWDSKADLRLKWTVIVAVLWEGLLWRIKEWRWFPSPRKLVPGAGEWFDRSLNRCAIVRLSDHHLLKSFAKSHGVEKVEPLIQGIIFAAAFLAGSGDREKGAEKEGALTVRNALSFRNAVLTLKVPTVAGNYSASFDSDYVLRGDKLCLELCADFRRMIKDPRTARRARERANVCEMGRAPRVGSTFTLGKTTYRMGAKEKHLLDLVQGKAFCPADVVTNNLLRMDETGWEEEKGFRVCAAQNAGVASARLTVTVLADSAAEMALVVCWQETALEVGEYARRFVEQLRVVLGKLDEGEADAETTLDAFRV